MIKKIFILENKKIKGIEKEKEKIEDLLKSCGKVVEKIFESPDLILTLGGDGTILNAIRMVKDRKTLIYGINYGKKGFLTNSSENIEKKIKDLLKGEFRICERMLIELNIERKSMSVYRERALNDFLIFRNNIRIITIEVFLNDKEKFEFRGDGILISTPTGSTAHSLSTGGPIIYPEFDSILITPFAPYSLSIRPLILSPETKIKIKISSSGKVISDGQVEFNIEKDDIIEIKKSDIKANLIIEESFFDKLITKFNFGK
jgi:NAD+ kinase